MALVVAQVHQTEMRLKEQLAFLSSTDVATITGFSTGLSMARVWF